jgi:hypothetical protein
MQKRWKILIPDKAEVLIFFSDLLKFPRSFAIYWYKEVLKLLNSQKNISVLN